MAEMKWICIVVSYVLFGFLEDGVTSHTTCAGTECQHGMKLCCMIKNGNPYKSCVSAGVSCYNYWSSSCNPCVLDCSSRDTCMCSCSERPYRSYG
uniref:Uncharacterized protein n=1 Tax=Rhipicephalus zambeziensis TaxID=60191 RepID=A0A224YKG8_9ACAR